MVKNLNKYDYCILIGAAVIVALSMQIFWILISRWINGAVPEYAQSTMVFFKLILWTAFVLTVYKFVICYTYHKCTMRSLYNDRRTYKRPFRALLRFYQTADPYRLDRETLPSERWQDAEGIILGKVGEKLIKRPSSGVGNLAVFSLPGGGKTTSQIIPSAMRFAGSVFAIDIKGDILRFVNEHGKRTIRVFDPENPHRSAHYNPFHGIEKLTELERRTLIEQIALVLLPDAKDHDGKYFVEGGRDYFCGVSLYLLHNKIETTLPTIARAIVNGNAFYWPKTVEDGPSEIAKSYLSSYIGTNEKNVAGAYGTIVKAIRPFAFGALAELLEPDENAVSTDTLESGCDVYIEIPQDKIKIYAPVTTIMVQQFLMAFMRREDNSSGAALRPVLFLLDEFPQLQFDYNTLMAALSTLRSKAVSLFLAFQSIAQAIQRYGDAGFRAIMDTCAYISVMSAQDPDSREFFSRLCGTHKYLKVTTTYDANGQKSKSISEEQETVFRPADFGNLGDDVVIVANGKYVRAKKTFCFKN